MHFLFKLMKPIFRQLAKYQISAAPYATLSAFKFVPYHKIIQKASSTQPH